VAVLMDMSLCDREETALCSQQVTLGPYYCWVT